MASVSRIVTCLALVVVLGVLGAQAATYEECIRAFNGAAYPSAKFKEYAGGWKPGQGTTCTSFVPGALSKCGLKFTPGTPTLNACWFDETSRKGNQWCPKNAKYPENGFIQIGGTCPSCRANLIGAPIQKYDIAIQSHCGGKNFEHIQTILGITDKGNNLQEWEVAHGGQSCGGAECSKIGTQTVNLATNEIVGSSMSKAVRGLCCPGGKTGGACAPGVPRTIKLIIFTRNVATIPGGAPPSSTPSNGGTNDNALQPQGPPAPAPAPATFSPPAPAPAPASAPAPAPAPAPAAGGGFFDNLFSSFKLWDSVKQNVAGGTDKA